MLTNRTWTLSCMGAFMGRCRCRKLWIPKEINLTNLDLPPWGKNGSECRIYSLHTHFTPRLSYGTYKAKDWSSIFSALQRKASSRIRARILCSTYSSFSSDVGERKWLGVDQGNAATCTPLLLNDRNINIAMAQGITIWKLSFNWDACETAFFSQSY